MKKILLILSILIMSSANVFAEDNEVEIPLDFLDNLQVKTPDFSPFDAPRKTLTNTFEEPDVDIPKETAKDLPQDSSVDASADILKNSPASLSGDKVPSVIPKANEKATLDDKVFWINLLEDDTQKIKEWAKISTTENYLIINKKDCSATVYDKNGNVVKMFEIGIGRDKGDDFNDTSGLVGKARNTTPAGEFTLNTNVFNKAAYGDLTLSLGTKANKSKKSKRIVTVLHYSSD